MRFEDITAMPPLATVARSCLIEKCRAAVTQRELAVLNPGDGGASGNAAAAETLALKAFFDGMSAKCAAVAATQDAEV